MFNREVVLCGRRSSLMMCTGTDDYRERFIDDMAASEAKDEVIAEYAACGLPLADDTDDELLVRRACRLRVTQFSQRPFWSLQRPRQPRS